MLARSSYLVRERIYPFTLLFVGLVLTAGWVCFLGYGLLALMAFDPRSSVQLRPAKPSWWPRLARYRLFSRKFAPALFAGEHP